MLRHRRNSDPWCSGPTCQPVTLEIAGSNPVGSAIDRITLTPRPPARTGRSSTLSVRHGLPGPRSGTIRPVKRLPLLVVAAIVVVSVAAAAIGGQLALGDGSSPSASPTTAAVAPSAEPTEPGATVRPGASAPPPAASEAPPTAAPATPAPDPVATEIAVVPVTQFRSNHTSTNREEVADVLAGRSDRYEALELVEADADAILEALGVDRPRNDDRLVLADDAEALMADLADNRRRLAFLRASEVGPGVRALAWGRRTLFGVERVTDPTDWRLTASLPDDDGTDDFDPAATWTLFAAGDIMLDRGVYQTVRVNGKGEDFPFDGGSAEITGHTCCSGFGHPVPTTRRTGDAGAVRDLMKSADIAIANFENPAPNRFRWHTSGTVFSADPSMIPGLARAGIDWVSLANNHIGDAGRNGILQTMRNLDKAGIEHSGAGRTLDEAREPSWFEVNGTRVAILGYDKIARYYHADDDTIGSAPFRTKLVRQDIKAAREAGADVVIVFPHWGREYAARPFDAQQAQGRAIIEAGADMIIGNHAHWAAALEIHEGKPIWYALGNFVFDQTWSEPTMEGMTLELTFDGAELVQARMRPHVILDKAQPNFLDPTGDGRVVMRQVYESSRGLLPW